jgi:hypothetical protein
MIYKNNKFHPKIKYPIHYTTNQRFNALKPSTNLMVQTNL